MTEGMIGQKTKMEDRPEYKAVLEVVKDKSVRGDHGAIARRIVEALDADEKADFERQWRKHYNAGAFQGAYAKGEQANGPTAAAAATQAGTLYQLYADFQARRWTPTRINGTVIGHMIVFWAMAANLAALFLLAGEWRAFAFAGAFAAVVAYASAWFAEVDSRLPFMRNACYLAAQISTAGSWLCALVWAFQLLR